MLLNRTFWIQVIGSNLSTAFCSWMKASYANASIVGAGRAVFNIKGNAYRLVVAVDYQRAIVFIKWLGTHKEYDAIDVRTIQYAPETNQD